MHSSISRRSLLAAMGCALLPLARAGEQAESSICLSMIYRNGPQAKFDATRYARDYLPMLKSVCGDSVERIELRTPRPFGMPGAGEPGKPRSTGSHTPQAAPEATGPLLATASIWINDAKAFGEKTAAASQLAAELQQVTAVEPLVQLEKVAALLGDARNSIPAQGNVVSTYFSATPGAQFDARYYGEKVIPMMIKLYGAKSIRRVEFNVGVAQGGQAPLVLASSHFYVRDRAAWDAAQMQAMPQLMAEGPKYTTARPLVADMLVTAAG